MLDVQEASRIDHSDHSIIIATAAVGAGDEERKKERKSSLTGIRGGGGVEEYMDMGGKSWMKGRDNPKEHKSRQPLSRREVGVGGEKSQKTTRNEKRNPRLKM